MRAWHISPFVFLATAMACGGTDATDDGGTDGGPGNDGTVDTGIFVDSGFDETSVGDAPAVDEGPIDAGPFNPSQLGSNLVLWLDAAKSVTQANNAVSAWADQTTYHNDASGGAGQFTHDPTINATAINNLPAVEFSGGFQQPQYLTIPDSASLEFGPGDFAVFMVAQYSNPITGQGAGQGTFYNKVAGNNTPTGPQLYGNASGPNPNTLVASIRARINGTDNVNSTATTYNDGKYHRIGIRRSGAVLEVWADGTSTALTPDAGGTVDVSATGSDVYIGASPGGNGTTLRLIGGVAEVIGVKGALSGTDVTNLDGYFKTKFGL